LSSHLTAAPGYQNTENSGILASASQRDMTSLFHKNNLTIMGLYGGVNRGQITPKQA